MINHTHAPKPSHEELAQQMEEFLSNGGEVNVHERPAWLPPVGSNKQPKWQKRTHKPNKNTPFEVSRRQYGPTTYQSDTPRKQKQIVSRGSATATLADVWPTNPNDQ